MVLRLFGVLYEYAGIICAAVFEFFNVRIMYLQHNVFDRR